MTDLTHRAVHRGSDVLVYPHVFADVAEVLFDLADHVEQVATNTDAGFALRIPTALYGRFQAYEGLEEVTPDAGNVTEPVNTPKRRGRPRKIPATEV